MEEIFAQTQIIVLAGGKGTRMESELPKVLMPLGGTTMVQYLLAGSVFPVSKIKPIIVTGYRSDLIHHALGEEKVVYAYQDEQLGTGHAVQVALDYIDPAATQVIVLYGDMPFTRIETLQSLAQVQFDTDSVMTMATTVTPDFSEWRSNFVNYGRIVRNSDGEVSKIVQKKDATPEEAMITEVDPALFAFDLAWLGSRLQQVRNDNAQQEYYLTNLVEMAFAEGHKIQTVAIEPQEALGANTKDQLATLQQFVWV